jgi:hypothetical protein
VPDEQSPEPTRVEKQLAINWGAPDDGPIHITNSVVQHTDHEFIVRHYQIYPPLLIGTDEEKATRLAELDSVQARCVGQFVMAPQRVEALIAALGENLARWKAKQAATDQSESR